MTMQHTDDHRHHDQPTRRHPLLAPSIVCGIGFGGFVDGIVFHQILQWHHMLSNTDGARFGIPTESVHTVAGLEVNTLWDGIFHGSAWVLLFVGVVWLWLRWRRLTPTWPPLRLLFGAMLVGWGTFNLVEGVVDHHILEIHHVVEGRFQTLADVLFLVAGAAMVAGGAALSREFWRSQPPVVRDPGQLQTRNG